MREREADEVTRYAETSCAEFTEKLASESPVPGGGGAAALAGALGVALGNMVGSLTAGRERYADVADEIASLDARAAELEEQLLDAIDADAAAFEALSRTWGMPKGTDAEIAARRSAVQSALARAAEPPLGIMEAAREGIDLCGRYAEIGSSQVVSDAGCGAALSRGALEAGWLNVLANTHSLDDREAAAAIEERARELLGTGRARADEVFALVEGRLS